MTIPHSDGNSVQRVLFAAKTGGFVHVRSTNQAPIQPVRPAVIPALYAAGKLSCIGDQPRASVAAHIVKSLHVLVGVPSDDYALAGDLSQEIITRFGDLLLPADAHP